MRAVKVDCGRFFRLLAVRREGMGDRVVRGIRRYLFHRQLDRIVTVLDELRIRGLDDLEVFLGFEALGGIILETVRMPELGRRAEGLANRAIRFWRFVEPEGSGVLEAFGAGAGHRWPLLRRQRPE